MGKYTGAKKIYNAGEVLPCGFIVKTGDTYVDECYEYKHNYYYFTSDWLKKTKQNGWGVHVLDNTKTKYGEMLNKISNKPVTTLYNTFSECILLKTAPTIPNSVIDMTQTFYGCTSLTTAPIISKNVVKMANTFSGCTSLTTAPVIPSNVTNMTQTFSGCTSLTTPPDMSKATSVINMYATFGKCTSLTTAPIIPNGVIDMNFTFSNCTSLTGIIEINANPTSYSNCFKNVKFISQNITLTGSSTKLSALKATGSNS